MKISDQNLLWANTLGICSKPGCGYDCTQHLGKRKVMGEMAHMIAKSPGGPRGVTSGGSNSYDNIILLCPNHHKEIDAAEELYPVEKLIEWKISHEAQIDKLRSGAKYESMHAMASYIQKLRIDSHQIWKIYGPESKEAKSNPLISTEMWCLRKLAKVVPNNREIINTLEKNKDLVSSGDWKIFRQFCEHAEGFERNCYTRTEGIPLFPPTFDKMINRHVRQ